MVKAVKSDQPLPERTSAGEVDRIREALARIIRIVLIVFALVLALGAFLVAVGDNVGQDNPLVRFVLGLAGAIDGPFSRDNGVLVFDGGNAATKGAVVNWGVAAIVYLVIGRWLQRFLAPKRRSVRR